MVESLTMKWVSRLLTTLLLTWWATVLLFFVDEDEAVEVGEGFGAADNVAREKNKLIDWVYIDHVRQQDKKLIKYMNVGTIVDFMVENKKVKYGFKYETMW